MILERIAIYKQNRALTYDAMDKLGVSYVPTDGNFFMMSVKGMTGTQVGAAMTARKIHLANRWASEWPNHIRVTIGSHDDMTKFNAVLAEIVKEGPPKAVAQAGEDTLQERMSGNAHCVYYPAFFRFESRPIGKWRLTVERVFADSAMSPADGPVQHMPITSSLIAYERRYF